MEYKKLGKTDINVSKMCFGTLTVGPLQANLSPEDGGAVIAEAIKLGVNFFDTAELYETYPHLLEGMKQSGNYDIVISSKTYAYTKEMAEKAVEDARRELDRDVIDIFMLHEQESIHTLRGHIEALDYLFECKEKGIVRAVGASMHHVEAVYGATELQLDVIHPILNLKGLGIVDGTREDMENALKTAHHNGIGIFSMKPLGGGNLFKNAEACLNYVNSLSFVDCVAIGCQSTDEVAANVNFFENGIFQELSKVKRKLLIDEYCSGCGNCVKRCGQSALSLENVKAVCDHSKCILCGYCASACPLFVIKVI